MALAFQGRLEARIDVPTGGASVSATVANGGSAATVTVPSASYFLTAAGGVSSLITTLQTQLNENSQGYPQTAAAMAAAVGYGTWVSGYLCNESSGSLSPVFGPALTLAPNGSVTYGNAGPRGGIDKSIAMDANNEGFSEGTNALGAADATSDLAVFAVVKTADVVSSATHAFSKTDFSGGAGWTFSIGTSETLTFQVDDGPDAVNTTCTAMPTATWCAIGFVLDRSTNRSRVGFAPIATGVATVGSEADTSAVGSLSASNPFRICRAGTVGGELQVAAFYIATGSGAATGLSSGLSTALTKFANAINAAWTVSVDTSGGTGRVSIGWSGYTTPTHSLSWTSTTLRDVLGFDANITNATSTTTGAAQAKGLVFLDAPLNCDDHPSMAPEETDLRASESPTGVQLSLSGNTKYAHTNARWERVPVDRIREASATYDNASLEVFFRDCIAGQGSSWFVPGTDLQIYWSNAGTDTLLGIDANDGAGVAGWRPSGISKFSELARPSQQGWVGAFDVRIPRLVSSG